MVGAVMVEKHLNENQIPHDRHLAVDEMKELELDLLKVVTPDLGLKHEAKLVDEAVELQLLLTVFLAQYRQLAQVDFKKLFMKKYISLLLLLSAISLQNSFAANFTPISCNDPSINNYSGSCNECFNAGSLYQRSNRAIENITGFYDTFSVTGTGSRVMWQDETTVSWSILNNKFILGSSLSSTRSNANGFKFQTIPGSWQTAQNAPNT